MPKIIQCFRKILLLLVVCSLLFGIAGCESFRKKFIRKKKKTDFTEEVILVPQEYPELTHDVAYNNHFIYWKYWVKELIDRIIEGSNKKNQECFKQALYQINEMKRYLTEEKQKELQAYIEDLNSLASKMGKVTLTEAEAYNIRRKLEVHLLNVEKKFYTKKVKEWIQ